MEDAPPCGSPAWLAPGSEGSGSPAEAQRNPLLLSCHRPLRAVSPQLGRGGVQEESLEVTGVRERLHVVPFPREMMTVASKTEKVGRQEAVELGTSFPMA